MIQAEYCADSGMKMTQACASDPRGSRRKIGYFVRGTEPTEFCSCHVPVSYDTLHGGVADENCPAEHVTTVGMLHVVRSFPIEVYVVDAQYVWRPLSEGVLPETASSLPFFQGMLAPNEFCGISRVSRPFNAYCRYHMKRSKSDLE